VGQGKVKWGKSGHYGVCAVKITGRGDIRTAFVGRGSEESDGERGKIEAGVREKDRPR